MPRPLKLIVTAKIQKSAFRVVASKARVIIFLCLDLISSLTTCLTKKTGIVYSFDIKVVKTVQEKQIDKTNPDEKFMNLCQENPKLMDFKQRLNLAIS